MPNYESNEDELTILIYPDNNATTLSKSLVYANDKKYKYMRAVFIDGTWYVLEYVCLKKRLTISSTHSLDSPCIKNIQNHMITELYSVRPVI